MKNETLNRLEDGIYIFYRLHQLLKVEYNAKTKPKKNHLDR